MATYSILAIIAEVRKSQLFFKGVGDYFRKLDDFSRNILSSEKDLIELEPKESCFVLEDKGDLTSDAFYRELFVHSMLDRKPLKFEFEVEITPEKRTFELIGVALADNQP